MPLKIINIAPEAFDMDKHSLPTAGELLLAGDSVTINADGIAYKALESDESHGLAIEVSRPGDVVEIAAMGEKQEDGGFYFEHICVVQEA